MESNTAPKPENTSRSLGDLSIELESEADRKLGASVRVLGAAIHTAIREEVDRQMEARFKLVFDSAVRELNRRNRAV